MNNMNNLYVFPEQWRIVFSSVKILLASFTVIVLLVGTFQGAISYGDYCNGHDDKDDYNQFDDYSSKRCDFGNGDRADVGFVAVVILSGVGAFLWVSTELKCVCLCVCVCVCVCVVCICVCM